VFVVYLIFVNFDFVVMAKEFELIILVEELKEFLDLLIIL